MIVPAYISESAAYSPEHRQTGHITYPVHIVVDGRPKPGTAPVIRVLDQPKSPPEMPTGELQVPAEYAAALTAAGYVCTGMATSHLKAYWDDARGRPVKKHWHPAARLVLF